MKARVVRAVLGTLALLAVAVPLSLVAQVPPSSAPPAQTPSVFNQAQLDQLLAPIALYPDQLVAQILMAATYPLEVVEAARWVQDPNNARLKGDPLAAALQDMDWDPSVKSLVPFPQILQMMNSRIDWMQKLGDAFLAQQSDVMDSVQRLRREAQKAGELKSSPQQVVSTEDQAVVIEPASPEAVYVPYYDPTVVYGVWPYPAYPPYYFPPPLGFIYGAPFFPGFWWEPVIDIGFFEPFWGWGWFDWGHRSIYVDRSRYDRIPGRRPPVSGNTWQHDPYHRRGVAYRDPGTAARYGRPVGSPDARRAYRGYESTPQVTRGTPATVLPGATAPRSAVQRAPSAPQPTVQRPATAPLPTVQRGAAIQRPTAPAFGGYQRGVDTRAESARGRASLQSMPARGAAPSVGGARPSSGGGGGGGARSSGGGSSGGSPLRR